MHEPEIHTSFQLTHDQQTPTRSTVTVNAKVEEEIGKIIGNYFLVVKITGARFCSLGARWCTLWAWLFIGNGNCSIRYRPVFDYRLFVVVDIVIIVIVSAILSYFSCIITCLEKYN